VGRLPFAQRCRLRDISVGLNGEYYGDACTKASSAFVRVFARCNEMAGAVYCRPKRLIRCRRRQVVFRRFVYAVLLVFRFVDFERGVGKTVD